MSWPKAKTISIGLEIHYYYIVWLQTGGGTFTNVSRILQLAGLDRLQSRITGLTFNTNYSVKLEPYREQKERRQSGTSTGVARFKIENTAPVCVDLGTGPVIGIAVLTFLLGGMFTAVILVSIIR